MPYNNAGQNLQPEYDKNGRLIAVNDVSTPKVSGWQATEQPMSYTDKLNAGMTTLERMNKYSDPYSQDVRGAYSALNNFSYDPNTDQAYQQFLQNNNNQSQAAQGQTLSNLTAISGGRNNSWASAATAQVGQTYAQKGANAQADFADRAYNRLLQRYGMANDMSNTAYGRSNDMFNRQSNLVGTYNQLGQQEYSNNRQNLMDSDYLRNSQQGYDINQYNFEQDQIYGPQERQLSLQNMQNQKNINEQAIRRGEIDLKYYDESVQLGLLSGRLSVEQANQSIQMGDLAYKSALRDYNNPSFKSSSGGGGGTKSTTKAPSTTAQTFQQKGVDSAIESTLKAYANQNGLGDIYNIPPNMFIGLVIDTVKDDAERDRILRKYKITDDDIQQFYKVWGSR